jgi:hypothetical protein
MVGLGPFDNVYVPTMWETYDVSAPEYRMFDFKYVNNRNIWGLNKPAVFTREELRELFALYELRTGMSSFP